jgi:hypothetical protein
VRFIGDMNDEHLGDPRTGGRLSDAGWRDGCGAIFRDSTSTRGRFLFAEYCDECRATKPARRHVQHERALAGAELHGRGWGFSRHSGVYVTSCCWCGEFFASNAVRQYTCATCRRKKRSGLSSTV